MNLPRFLRFAVIAGFAIAAYPAAPLRVLFIGNSLTAVNGVPAQVERIARANGDRIVTRTVAYPNYSLEDHWNMGDARRAIAEGGWSVVVLQQGPSALLESRRLLVEYAKRFAQEARRVRAKTALYMVWPASNRMGDFDGVKLSYETAAREVAGIFLPAGEAWRLAWRQDADLALYGPDGFHPSLLGSHFAAMVIYEGLMGKVPVKSSGLPERTAEILRQAASEALGQRNAVPK